MKKLLIVCLSGAALAVPVCAQTQTTKPTYKTFKYEDGGIMTGMSDNGQWGTFCAQAEDAATTRVYRVGARLTNMQTTESLSLTEGLLADTVKSSAANDVTNDGNIVVGALNDRPAYYNVNEKAWHFVHFTGYYGSIGSVTPDGRYAVGTIRPNDNEYNEKPALWDMATGDTIATPNLPQKDMAHENMGQNRFVSISADGKRVLGCMSFSYLPTEMSAGGCFYYVYDVDKQAYKVIGFTESDTDDWTPKADHLLFVSGAGMSNNGKYVTGSAYYFDNQGSSDASVASLLLGTDGTKLYAYPATQQNLLKDVDYQVVLPAGVVTDITGKSEAKLDGDWKENTISLAPFAGKNVYIAFVNQNEAQSFVFVDDIQVTHDLPLFAAFDTETTVVGKTSAPVKGSIVINDNNTYSTLHMTLKDGQGKVVDEIDETGLSLTKGDKHAFSFAKALPLTVGAINRYSVDFKLGDKENTVSKSISNLSFEPVKRVVLEEFTGMGCTNCPLGILGIDNLHRTYGDLFIPMALHCYTGDQLATGVTGYAAYLDLTAAPSGRIQRGDITYPITQDKTTGKYSFAPTDNTTYDVTWLSEVQNQLAAPAPAEVSATCKLSANGTSLKVPVSVKYALNATDLNLKVFAVVLENGLKGYQSNGFSSVSDPVIGEWGTGGKYGMATVTPYTFDHVVRGFYGETFTGTPELLPTTIEAGKDYTTTLTIPVPDVVENAANTDVVVMLFDGNTDKLINVCKASQGETPDGIDNVVTDNTTAAVTVTASRGTVVVATQLDADGIVTLTFDGNIKLAADKVTLTYADNSSGAEASAKYVEVPPYTIDGSTLTIDLTNKERTPQGMLGISTVYESMKLTVSNVCDTEGNPVYTSTNGSRGSYAVSMPYSVETVEANTEITPATGSMLGNTKQIEIFATDYKKFSFSGVKFVYTDANNTTKVATVARDACTEDLDSLYQFDVTTPDVISLGALALSEAHVFDMLNTVDVPVASAQFIFDDPTVQEINDYIESNSYEEAEAKYGAEATQKAYLTSTNTVRLTLAQPITEEGGYTLYIPAGYFDSGEQFEGVISKTYEGFFTVKGQEEPVSANFTTNPANGSTVSSLSTISITYDDLEEIGTGSGVITVKKDGEVIETLDAELDWDVWNKANITLSSEQTAQGIYTIEIPEGYFVTTEGDDLPAVTLEYGIGIATGINTAKADVKSEATYTLGGVRVSGKLPAGLYIKGGKKVVIK